MPKEKAEKPVPKPCICGRGVTVVNRGKKMVSCPDPCNCPGNLRTRWHGNEESAIVEQGCKDLGDWWRVYGTRVKRIRFWMPLPEAPKEG